ncbi:MAG: MucR family transcriptional regulator [Acetobacteraceae bacterium]
MYDSHADVLALAAQIVSAHVENNETASEALPNLIREVYQTLVSVNATATPRSVATVPDGSPAAPDRLTCRECGMTMKMLKRHLITVHGLTPEEYRAKWNLAADSPMVASNYAALRSKLAKESGLGKRPEANARKGRAAWR